MAKRKVVKPQATLRRTSKLNVVLSTASPAEAPALARALVEAGVAACVNLVPGVQSVYRWDGKLCEDGETLLLIKTPKAKLKALFAALHERHSYTVPEFVALGVTGASAGYEAWAVTL